MHSTFGGRQLEWAGTGWSAQQSQEGLQITCRHVRYDHSGTAYQERAPAPWERLFTQNKTNPPVNNHLHGLTQIICVSYTN
jgi:hypothetical protein